MAAALFIALLVVALVFLAGFLGTAWNREQIKRDLADRALTVVKIRWEPFAWWADARNSQGFIVTYANAVGTQHVSRCSVWWRDVRWVPDDLHYLDSQQSWVVRGGFLLMAAVVLYFSLRWLARGELVWHSRMRRTFHIHGAELMFLCASLFSVASSFSIRGLYFGRGPRSERAWTVVARGLMFVAFALFVASMVVGFIARLRS